MPNSSDEALRYCGVRSKMQMDVTCEYITEPESFHLFFARHGISNVIAHRQLASRRDLRVMEAMSTDYRALATQQAVFGELNRCVSKLNERCVICMDSGNTPAIA